MFFLKLTTKSLCQMIIVALSTAVTTAAWSVSADCLQQANGNFPKLEACLTLENLVQHLQEFQRDADTNSTIPGTRFMGTSGYEASKKYIVDKLQNAGYHV